MKRRRFSFEVRPGAVVLLAGLYFLLPLRWCVRLALTVTVHELGHVAALILCGAQVCGLRMEGCGLVLRCTPPEGALRTVAAALAGRHTVVTHEVASPTLKRIKIPNVCVGLGIEFMNPYQMLRKEQARFVLGG